VADLAQRLSIAPEEIEFIRLDLVEWPDSSLGCPQPGVEYLEVLVDGYVIQLKVGQRVYAYHGGRSMSFLCEKSAWATSVS
jgi:hypothetical protein